MVFRETARQDARERRVAHRFADPQHHAQYNDHREWMPVDRPSVVVVACTARFSYRQPRSLWTFDERQLSIPTGEFPAVLDRKVLQMTDDSRIRFKIKLGAAFGRNTPDEEATGHPWLADEPPTE